MMLDLDLHEREPESQAHPGSPAEGDEGHRVPGRLGRLREPLGVEPLRVWPVPLVHVNPQHGNLFQSRRDYNLQGVPAACRPS